ARAQRSDLGVGSGVEHQNLVSVLTQYEIAVVRRVRQNVDKPSRNIDEGAALVRIATVDQNANVLRNIHRRDRAQPHRYRGGAFLVLEYDRIIGDSDRSRSDAGRWRDADTGRERGQREVGGAATWIGDRNFLSCNAAIAGI